MPVQEVNYAIFNFPAPAKAQNGPVLEGTTSSAQLLAVANSVIHLHKNLASSFVNAEKFLEGKPKHQDQKPGPNESNDSVSWFLP